MNSKTNNFDLYSTFTYDEAKKYYESTSLDCKSDNDCPERSSCIGNKCIVSFYCKKDDKSTCSLYTNFCDGKSCYKSDNQCDKNTDCLSGQCNNSTCTNYYSEGKYNKPKFSFDEYSINHFTYDNAKYYYEKLNVTCTSDDNCPNHTYCFDNSFPYEHTSFHCSSGENCSSHCISHFYCKKDKSDCSYTYDKENDYRFSSKISAVKDIFGLETGKICRNDQECISNRCGCDVLNIFAKGSCEEPSDSDSVCALPYVLFIYPLIFIESILIVVICINLFKRNRLKKEGLVIEERKIKTLLKRCIISGSVIGVFLLFFYFNKIFL